MAATPSTMLALGTALPDFTLSDVSTSRPVSSRDLDSRRGVLVMFICNHCPFVIHIRGPLVAVAHQALDEGLSVVAINSNSIITHPEDGPLHMRELAAAESWRFPFLFDDQQDVARAFHAACTPDLFLFDAQRRLAYRGQFDDSRPSNGRPVTGNDLRAAIAAVARGEKPGPDQTASIGCSIKWAPT